MTKASRDRRKARRAKTSPAANSYYQIAYEDQSTTYILMSEKAMKIWDEMLTEYCNHLNLTTMEDTKDHFPEFNKLILEMWFRFEYIGFTPANEHMPESFSIAFGDKNLKDLRAEGYIVTVVVTEDKKYLNHMYEMAVDLLKEVKNKKQ